MVNGTVDFLGIKGVKDETTVNLDNLISQFLDTLCRLSSWTTSGQSNSLVLLVRVEWKTPWWSLHTPFKKYRPSIKVTVFEKPYPYFGGEMATFVTTNPNSSNRFQWLTTYQLHIWIPTDYSFALKRWRGTTEGLVLLLRLVVVTIRYYFFPCILFSVQTQNSYSTSFTPYIINSDLYPYEKK